MLRALCLPLLGLALLTETAVAQTAPAPKTTPKAKTAAPRRAPASPPAARRADPLRGTNDNGVSQSGYAAPGEPIQDPRYNGKNTPPYDGAAAPAKRNTTLNAPK